MPFLKRVFGKSDGSKSKKNAVPVTNGHADPVQPQWTDAWARTNVHAEEVSELIRGCSNELKSRGEWIEVPERVLLHDTDPGVGLDMPFLLLPFRPTSDPSAARTFIRNYFSPLSGNFLKGEALLQELRLSEPMVGKSYLPYGR